MRNWAPLPLSRYGGRGLWLARETRPRSARSLSVGGFAERAPCPLRKPGVASSVDRACAGLASAPEGPLAKLACARAAVRATASTASAPSNRLGNWAPLRLSRYRGRVLGPARETGRCFVCRPRLCRFGERSSRPARETRSRGVCRPSVDQYRERAFEPLRELGAAAFEPVWRAGLGARSRNSPALGPQSERWRVNRALPKAPSRNWALRRL